MRQTSVDLLIIGGGINGSGIARDAAGRGLSVLLCEARDLAHGTSSASSKLIHGGLRYLEYGAFRLVHEALFEREVLLRIAPHLIWPLQFILPWQRQLRPHWLLRFGLFIYDHLAKRPTLPRSKSVKLSAQADNPLKAEFSTGFSYSDCFVDDARLVVLNALSAAEHGAQIMTQARITHIERQPHDWHAVIEQAGQADLLIRAKCVINATGPWVDDIHADLLKTASRHHLRKVKGSHLIFRQFYQGNQAYILQNHDKRIVFVIPYYNDTVIIGTTDIAFQGNPSDAHITPEESTYLCAVVNHYFQQQLQPAHALGHYSGVRGLVAMVDKTPSSASRDYVLELNDQPGPPLLTVFGGKMTTYRQLAEHAVQKIQVLLKNDQPPWTATQPLPGGDLDGLTWAAFLCHVKARYPFLPEKMGYRLARAYGSRIHRLLHNTTSLAALGLHFGADLYEAEVRYLYQHEWASSADDILWRRTKIGLQLTAELHFSLTHFLKDLSCKPRQ